MPFLLLYIYIVVLIRSNQLIDTNDEQVIPIVPPVVPVPSSSSGSNNKYRGVHVELPKNFLRVSYSYL